MAIPTVLADSKEATTLAHQLPLSDRGRAVRKQPRRSDPERSRKVLQERAVSRVANAAPRDGSGRIPVIARSGRHHVDED